MLALPRIVEREDNTGCNPLTLALPRFDEREDEMRCNPLMLALPRFLILTTALLSGPLTGADMRSAVVGSGRTCCCTISGATLSEAVFFQPVCGAELALRPMSLSLSCLETHVC